MVAPKHRFEHGARQLANGKFVGTVTFFEENGASRSIPINYPEQFDSEEDAVAHAFREAVIGRAFPF